MLSTTVLSILAWLSLSLSVSLRLEKGYGAGLLITACIIILIQFTGMILGVLGFTYYAIIVGALLHAILRGWTWETAKSQLSTNKFSLEKFKNSYAILYIVAIITAILFTRKVFPEFTFFGWDEFSHWARYTKILVNTSVAPVDNPAVLFPDYPPGINLWHYYICGPGGYAEWKVVFSQMLLVIAAIIFTSTNFGRLKGLGTVMIFAFGLMIYHAFGTNLYEIYTDCILGLLFAAALLIARSLALDTSSKYAAAALIIILATISLIKPIAILFSITACGLFFGLRLTQFLGLFFKKLSKYTKLENTESLQKSVGFTKSLLQTVIYAGAAFSTVFVWKVYTSLYSVKSQLVDGKNVGMSEVIEFLFVRDTMETKIAWKELGDRIGFERVSTFGEIQFRLDKGFFDPDFPIYRGAIYLLYVTLALFLLRLVFNHKKALMTIAEGLYLSVTFILYLLVIVFMIRYFFQPYDIERLASLERYLSSFLLGIMLYAVVTLVTDMSKFKISGKVDIQAVAMPVIWAGLSLVIISLSPVALDSTFAKPLSERPVPSVHPWINEYDEMVEVRQQISTLSNIVKNNAKVGDKIYVIAQQETGYTFYMTGHELSPLQTNPNCFSVGEKYSEGDNWTCDWMNFPEVLKSYDYVVLRRADKAFWSSYGNIFEPAARGYESGVFSIDKSAETVKLKSLYLLQKARGEGSPT